ncbi:hypothetical protein C6P44_003621, partial [Monosporozyma unispora]
MTSIKPSVLWFILLFTTLFKRVHGDCETIDYYTTKCSGSHSFVYGITLSSRQTMSLAAGGDYTIGGFTIDVQQSAAKLVIGSTSGSPTTVSFGSTSTIRNEGTIEISNTVTRDSDNKFILNKSTTGSGNWRFYESYSSTRKEIDLGSTHYGMSGGDLDVSGNVALTLHVGYGTSDWKKISLSGPSQINSDGSTVGAYIEVSGGIQAESVSAFNGAIIWDTTVRNTELPGSFAFSHGAFLLKRSASSHVLSFSGSGFFGILSSSTDVSYELEGTCYTRLALSKGSLTYNLVRSGKTLTHSKGSVIWEGETADGVFFGSAQLCPANFQYITSSIDKMTTVSTSRNFLSDLHSSIGLSMTETHYVVVGPPITHFTTTTVTADVVLLTTTTSVAMVRGKDYSYTPTEVIIIQTPKSEPSTTLYLTSTRSIAAAVTTTYATTIVDRYGRSTTGVVILVETPHPTP